MTSQTLRDIVVRKKTNLLDSVFESFEKNLVYGEEVKFKVYKFYHTSNTALIEEYLFYLLLAFVTNLRAYRSALIPELRKPENKGLEKEVLCLYHFFAYCLLEPTNVYIGSTGLIIFKEPIGGFDNLFVFYENNMLHVHFKSYFYRSLKPQQLTSVQGSTIYFKEPRVFTGSFSKRFCSS
jgi:hypothetical protein